MNRETTAAHVRTWQFFSSCAEIFKPLCSKGGISYLSKLFGVTIRQVQRWSCDPDFSESAQRNPMDKYETVLKKLCELGRYDVARGAVDRQAAVVGCRLVSSRAVPDKDSLTDELLDNLPALADYQEAVTAGEDLQVIRRLARKVIDEIEQDLALIEAGEKAAADPGVGKSDRKAG